ncbi:MAG: VWA domain-containing protein [Acidobacteriota bacterium]|nr:VWA domain-containing protein [Acidobacteriota bacterium]
MSTKLRFDVLTDKAYRPTAGEFVVRLACRMSVSDLAETLPLDLCLLIDKSLSMRGAKIEAARSAARRLISGMREGDRLSMIAFGTNVETLADRVVISPVTRSELLVSVDELEAGGVTRMDLALDQALERLGANPDYLSMMLLLSDGAPTNQAGYVLDDGACSDLRDKLAGAFGRRSVITSTIGLGDAEDCLAPFLDSCAEFGGGVFYHEDDPENLAARFVEEFDRIKDTAVADARFTLNNIHGKLRRAAAVLPEIREIPMSAEGEGMVLEAGALQKGEEHVFLLEIITPPADGPCKQPLGDISVSYKLDGETHMREAEPQLLEYTNEESLLTKPGQPDVERYKGLYQAFFQTRKAVDNVRQGGDTKKTRALLQSAAKTTRRLGLAKQTKLLNQIDRKLENTGSITENELTAAGTGSRKTRVLAR